MHYFCIDSDTAVTAFAKLQKATVSIVVCVFPSVHPQRTTPLPLDGFP